MAEKTKKELLSELVNDYLITEAEHEEMSKEITRLMSQRDQLEDALRRGREAIAKRLGIGI